MKNLLLFSFICLSITLAGCIIDVTEQETSHQAFGTGNGVNFVFFDASIYRQEFDVQGSASDTLIANGTFSLWAPGSGTATSIAQNVNMYWSVDTLHNAQLVAYAEGPQKELLSIDKMSATIPAPVHLKIESGSTDVNVQNMKGDLELYSSSGNINFATTGRLANVQSSSGKITGSTADGGSVECGSADITVTLSSPSFESIFANDTTGNIYIHVPANVGVTFKLQTTKGRITLSYDNYTDASFSAINHTEHGGGRVVYASTESGNIFVSN